MLAIDGYCTCSSSPISCKTDGPLCCRIQVNAVPYMTSYVFIDWHLKPLDNKLNCKWTSSNLPKFFLPNFLWSLFAKLFYLQCFLLYSILMSRFANQRKSTLQKKQAHRLVILLISVTIILITTSVYTHAYHYPLFESATKPGL